MLKKITILLFFLITVTGSSQEICNNLIDDDGDGLIDMNDPDCPCGGIAPPGYTIVPSICGATGSITITTPANFYSFDGGITWQSSPILQNITAGIYSLAIKDLQGCVSDLTQATLTQTPTLPAPATSAVLSLCGSGHITIYTPGDLFSFDGGITWTDNPVFTDFLPNQTYTLLSMENGCISFPKAFTTIATLPIPPAPQIITTQPSCSVPNGFIIVTTPAYQYSFDNGTTWSSSNISGSLPPGTYNIKIIYQDSCPSYPATSTIFFLGGPPPTPETVTINPTCFVDTGTITVNTPADLYSFDNGATWTVSNTKSNLYPGSYTVKTKNNNGCESIETIVSIADTGKPQIPTVSVDNQDCSNIFTITIMDPVTEFSFDNGLTWSTSNVSSQLSPGTYYIKVKNAVGCESDALEIPLLNNTVSPPTTFNIDYCQHTAASALSAIGNSLRWYSDAEGGTGTTIAPTPSTSLPGIFNYYVSQTINGCESSRAIITVNITASPSLPIVQSPISYCLDSLVQQLHATGQNLQWYTSFTGGTGSTVAPTPLSTIPGTYNYYLSQTINGCESERTTITVYIIQTPEPPETTSHIVYKHFEKTAPLTAIGNDLKWYDENGNILSGAPIPDSKEIGIENYFVSQSDDGCESEHINIIVEIKPNNLTIEYPKFFTPNGDGSNELWNITSPKNGVKAKIYVFDRYGKVIAQIFSPGSGWDGKYDGHNLPATDYWFLVRYTEYGTEKEFKSHFSLIR